MSVVDTVKETLERARERSGLLDHVIRTVQHYGSAKGNTQAGAITYFGFLSFFPIMALAFFAVGYVANYFPDAEDQLVEAINQVLPGMVSTDGSDDTIAISDIQDAAGAAAGLGVIGLLYAGLGWLSAMRMGLMAAFEVPDREKPNFVVGKGKDLASLVLIGVVLFLSVAIAGAVTGFSDDILEWIGLGSELGWSLDLLGIVVGLATNSLLFYAIFRLLVGPDTPVRSLWGGALLGAIGFELLKQLSTFLIAATKNQPAFQVFGIALILLVWINYFSRVVIYAASWAHTSAAARDAREAAEEGAGLVEGPRFDLEAASRPGVAVPSGPPPRAAFAAGAGAMLGVMALVRRFVRRDG